MARKIYLVMPAAAAALSLAFLYTGSGSAPPAEIDKPTDTRKGASASPWFHMAASLDAISQKTRIPLGQQIDSLIASGKPEDAFKAYILVNNCLMFAEWGEIPFFHFPDKREMTAQEKQEQAELCSGMTQRIKMNRLHHLTIAARARVPGADGAFLEEGPFGDPSALVSRPDDPLVKEWKQTAIELLTAQARNADWGSAAILLQQYSAGSAVVEKNPTLALTYLLALRDMGEEIHLYRDIPNPYGGAMLQEMKKGMSENDISAATTAASEILATYRRRLTPKK
jgi:hypothetical protein